MKKTDPNTITILTLDPSGAYNEGKGTTGYSIWLFNTISKGYGILLTGNIRAEHFSNQYDYFSSHLDLIKRAEPDVIVMEDFTLYANKAKQQIGSTMETPQLIGLIKFYCAEYNIELVMQRAVDVKNRWSDKILEYKGLVYRDPRGSFRDMNHYKVSRHAKDAIRHGIHYITKRIKELNI